MGLHDQNGSPLPFKICQFGVTADRAWRADRLSCSIILVGILNGERESLIRILAIERRREIVIGRFPFLSKRGGHVVKLVVAETGFKTSRLQGRAIRFRIGSGHGYESGLDEGRVSSQGAGDLVPIHVGQCQVA